MAGLTAAYRLVCQGYRVTIVDHAPQLGSPLIGEDLTDISEAFIILGCHHATQTLLQTLYANGQQPLQRDSGVEFRRQDGSLIRYPHTWLPAPLHTWISLLRFSGIPWSERWRLLSRLERIWEGEERLPADLEQRTADEWLASIGQSQHTRCDVWNPLAQWLTGNDLNTLSADAFMASIRPLFLTACADSRISIVQTSMYRCFVQPITQVLTEAGASILCQHDAILLHYERDHISGIQLHDGTLLQADWYIAALPPRQLTPMLPERWLTRYAYFQQLAELTSSDSTIIRIQADQPCTTPRLVLLGNTAFHSVLATRAGTDRTNFSFVTTDTRFAQAQLSTDLETPIPGLLRSTGLLRPGYTIGPIHRRTIPNAILSLRPGTKLHRPIQRSPIANLLVAGNWTDTGWPPNLESAIVSGNRCADAITLR